MTDLDFYDRVACRLWPDLSVRTVRDRFSTTNLVKDIVEGTERYTISDELRQRVEEAVKDEKENK